ncbi:hypothetical protein BJX70DRAFT_408449 [Aspergillus crustosus]
MSSLPSLVVCGSQTIPPTPEALNQLASYLRQASGLKALYEEIVSLTELWAHLKTVEPRFQTLSDGPVTGLRDWLLHPTVSPTESNQDSHAALEIPDTLPNALLAPLTVIIHIAQYVQYLDGLELDDSDDAHTHIQKITASHESNASLKFQGLCIGSLSAAALEMSPTRATLGQNAALAVRLAMCIGAYVDSERLVMTTDGGSPYVDPEMLCFIARWGTACSRGEIEEILKRYPEAYISVELDRNSVTITAPDCDAPLLWQELGSKCVRVVDVPVKGRYHSEENERILQSLLRLSSSDSAPFLVSWGHKLELCLRSILTQPVDWYSDVSKTLSEFTPSEFQGSTIILELGLVGCIPPSLSGLAQHQIIRGSLVAREVSYSYPDNSIAIIGAACKYPGADSLNELWKIITEGQVMYGKAPPGRFRSKEPVTGNFLSEADQFDYGLFGISPREATYMDPQQRIALQVAYQAIESSGYFGSPNPDTDVGCYVGAGSSDYEHNVNSNTPTAYSFTGTSRAFISGRVSHYFKWTGPSLTLDTACSSSATAIHQACNGIVMGDCSIALAGGVHIISSHPAHQNIAAAGMTNSTGPCRPFDADAVGYSRGEGCGFIVIKRLSTALADGDNILGVIPATVTNQSDGSTSITVPVAKTQSDLYRRALSRAAMSPADISYVEAHGTGTQRGDPVEYESVRQVFCGKQMVSMGSVKANIGHTEAASGVAGVLKVLMMLRHGQIPPQVNFTRINPAISAQSSDRLAISMRQKIWDTGFRAACVNNYGAAGNNTAIIICQPPRMAVPSATTQSLTQSRWPFLISAQSQASLRAYCTTLFRYIETRSPSLAEVASLVAQQQNRRLHHRIVFSTSSVPELQSLLKHHAQLDRETSTPPLHNDQAKPAILVFGGQTGSKVHLSKTVYDASYFLRQHVDKCDALIRGMGLPSILLNIFSPGPIEDVVMLHCCLFTVQYACAAAWLEAGLSVRRVIGHSFGQLTAMCTSGVITLDDALRLVVGRANLIKNCWGDERGRMLSVEIDRDGAQSLAALSDPDDPIEIACYNGLGNHVLVGSEAAIAEVEKRVSQSTRRLKTTHGFHSRFVDPLMIQYLDLTRSISYQSAVIPFETCSDTSTWTAVTAELVAEHSRKPVYFCDAVRRIERDLGSCIWLEAGSGSGVVTLARQSLSNISNSFCGLQLGPSSSNPMESVIDATLELWRQGVSVQCWIYHHKTSSQTADIDLPGYQFDTSAHWLSCSEPDPNSDPTLSPILEDRDLISLAHLSHPEPRVSRFEIDQEHSSLVHILRGREVLGGALWPLAMYIEVVSRAAGLLTPSLPIESLHVWVSGLEIKIPLGARPVADLRLRLEQTYICTWEFSLESESAQHAIGRVVLDDERTGTGQLGLTKASHLQSCPKISTLPFSAPGSVAYKLLDKVVEYDPAYRGIESVSMNGDEAIARVCLPQEAENYTGKTTCNPILLDQFLALAEIHALTMEDSARSEVFACSGLGEAIISAKLAVTGCSRSWSVYTRQSAKHGREIVYDTFVYDDKEGLVVALTGTRFLRISTLALQQVVERANAVSESLEIPSRISSKLEEEIANVWSCITKILHELTGCPPEHISAQTILADLGMDSLAMMEFEARIKAVFAVGIPLGTVDPIATVKTICDRIAAAQTSARSSISIGTSTPTSSPQYTPPDSGASPFESDNEAHTQATEIDFETIATIVASHLSTGEKLQPNAQIHGLGLDSLATLELQSDLQKEFGVRVQLMQLGSSTTIGDLYALVKADAPHSKRG